MKPDFRKGNLKGYPGTSNNLSMFDELGNVAGPKEVDKA